MNQEAKKYIDAGINPEVAKLYVKFDELSSGGLKLSNEAENLLKDIKIEHLSGIHPLLGSYEKGVITLTDTAEERDLFHEKLHAWVDKSNTFNPKEFQKEFNEIDNEKTNLINDIIKADKINYGDFKEDELSEERFVYLGELVGGDINDIPLKLQHFYTDVFQFNESVLTLSEELIQGLDALKSASGRINQLLSNFILIKHGQ